MPQIWAASQNWLWNTHQHTPVYLSARLEGPVGGDAYKVLNTMFGAWQEMRVSIVVSDSRHSLSHAHLSLFSCPQISCFSLETQRGMPFSKSFSPSFILIVYGLSFNRRGLTTYCGPNLVPGTTDTNMIDYNLTLALRCPQDIWWTRCNWV